MNTGERKVHDMVRKFGVEVFRQGVKDLLDLGERQARALLAAFPTATIFSPTTSTKTRRAGCPCGSPSR